MIMDEKPRMSHDQLNARSKRLIVTLDRFEITLVKFLIQGYFGNVDLYR